MGPLPAGADFALNEVLRFLMQKKSVFLYRLATAVPQAPADAKVTRQQVVCNEILSLTCPVSYDGRR